MKICSLTLDQFKKFTSLTVVEDFEDGLNVISGPNEMGKSTILDAIKAVLFERHKSKSSVIKSFQHATNDTAPVISLVFEIDGTQYKIEKKFIKTPYAKLTMPNRVVDGDEAEEILQNLLGFNQSGKSGASADSLGLWSVLWVRQGESLYSELSDLACNTIQSCLEAEVGILTGGQRGQALPPAIETALYEIVDKREKPKGHYKEVLERLAAIQSQIVELKSKHQNIDEDLTQLEKCKKELQSLQSAQSEADAQAELEDAKMRREEISKIESQISLTEKEILLLKNELETRQKTLEDRKAQIKNNEKAEKEVQDVTEAIKNAVENEQKFAREVAELKIRVHDFEKHKLEVEKELKHLRALSELIDSQERIKRLEESYKLASEAHQVYLKLKRQADDIKIAPLMVTDLQKASKAQEHASMALHACATSLFFDIRPENKSQIKLNGETLSSPDPVLQVVDEMVVEIDDIGCIKIAPGINDKKTLTEALRKATDKLNALLEEADVKTLEAAEAALEKKKQIHYQAESKLKESLIYAPGDQKAKLPPGHTALEQYITDLQADLKNSSDGLALDKLPSISEIKDSLFQIEKKADELQVEYDQARSALAGPEASWDSFKTELIQRQSDLEHAKANASRIKQYLEAAEKEMPKKSIQTEIDEFVKKIDTESGKLKQLNAQQGEDTLELLEARIKRFEERITNRRNRINQLNIQISGLQNRIQVLEADGLEEKIAVYENQEDKLLREDAWFEREVKILRLLQKTLNEAEAEAKERYLAPVVNKIRPHLQVLFPKSTVEIDDSFKITGIVRDGNTVESFEHLSLGTKEQIAILVRLAFAEMLIDQGKPAALILDDALIFSDDERIGLMFDILNMAAMKMQVIVFTCRQKVFESLGGNQINVKGNKEKVIEPPSALQVIA